ncbi:protein translocase subunit SecF [Nanchangia anserum]|uniref:Protein-export membrane protein SecF n=1 Tax=Nanchangia anserum TaxID=2692125 RepID=A0A8I0G6M6_9ACTO|nr:protein translocase subunit SecF [Nanchangia anserum]MBD3688757.1 protein translocase subunit SecF [Nanchangia anserum]QOX82498.1 protein translocase subunit SecF [Nanchangia anserum]
MMSFAQWGNELYAGTRSYSIVGHRKQWLSIGLVFIVLSVILLIVPGLSQSIEFRGGTEFTVSHVREANQAPARTVITELKQLDGASVTSLGQSGVRIQSGTMSTSDSREVVDRLAKAYKVDADEVASTGIGPSWGRDVTVKAATSLAVFFVLVGLMLAIYFKTVTMAAAALFALCHDVLITAAIFAITRVEVSPATVIGVLTILAFSLYDTVVVFDKVRELTTDFTQQSRSTYAELVNLSVNQTMVRSINTSVVAILPIGAILFVSTVVLGGGTLRDISMALFIGTIVGTWSSIFIASPALVFMRERTKKVAEHTKLVLQRRQGISNRALRQGTVSVDPAEAGDDVAAKPLVAGHHRGRAAQPSRKPRSKR